MITAMLQGGLGNQMFQYAMALSCARRLGVDFQLDISLLRNDKLRQYNLCLFKGVTERLVMASHARVYERGLPFDQELYDKIKDGDVLRGYWQTEKYFSNVADELVKKFKPVHAPSGLFAKDIEKEILNAGECSTFLTIRRTDYVEKQDFHGVLPIEYYNAALDIVAERFYPKVFVFSDEPEWCKRNLKLKYPFRVAGSFNQTNSLVLGREDVDMNLMSLCHNAVLANSSFSWWGAWLGDSYSKSGRVVVAPERWFTTTEVDSRDIVPKRWIQI